MDNQDRSKDADYINFEANTDYRASLCIYSSEIDIQAISDILGCEPTEAYKKGDILGKIKTQHARIGLWSLEAPSNLSFPDQLKYLIENTTPDQKTWDRLSTNHEIQLRCTAFLHSWTDGFDIPLNILTEIARRHWQFGLSMYSAEGEEIVKAFLKPNQNIKGNN